MTPTIKEGVVTGLEFKTDNVTDLSPLQALRGLQMLSCTGSAPAAGKVSDLQPLQSLKLVWLDCSYNPKVSNLSHLVDMPLVDLGIAGTQVANLAPLKNLSIMKLNCAGTQVTNLSAVKDTVRILDITATPIRDLSQLRGMPLKYLHCRVRVRYEEFVLSLKLTELNGKPIDEFQKDVARRRKEAADKQKYEKEIGKKNAEEQVKAIAAKLKGLNPGFDPKTVKPTFKKGVVIGLQFPTDNVTDISPVQALPRLQQLNCKGKAEGKGKLVNLQPLQGMALTELHFDFKPLSDQLAVVSSMKTLKEINGESASAFLEKAKHLQEEEQRKAKQTAKPSKPVPTQKFVGKLLSDPLEAPRTADGEKILTVQTTETVLVPNAYHAKKIVKQRLQYLAALRDSDLGRRIQRLQEEQYHIADHQAQLYTLVEAKRNIDLVVDANTKIRKKTLPPIFDEKGRPITYSRAEEDRKKGPDKRLPGYEAKVSELLKGQFVEIYVTPAAPAKAADEKNEPKGNPRSRVKLIVILP
jgi:hypothetical protein